MRIDNIEQIKKIGEEYGWDDRTIEDALADAIRLCYADRGMLVEVDVNMKDQSISARRFSGYGDSGIWVDIRDPIMPNVKMFLQVMEMQQWGDGSPGRLVEGEVAGHRDGGVIYRVLNQHVYVPENLLSVADYHQRPEVGDQQVIALCASKDTSGMRQGTRRGIEFVSAVMDVYAPDTVKGLWMGASNSWAVVRMAEENMETWLENGGVNVRHLQKVMGIRRITLLPEGQGETEQERKDDEVRKFIGNAWKDCDIVELAPERIVIHTPLNHNDPRKLRTFTSMLKKIAPEREQVVL